jgi:arylsulfatase A-like enzyme
MNGIWLILDSLSFSATPFGTDGPDTMPKYEALVADQGINFTRAYAPGPFSPSSHSSFFTGQLPSAAGMYEAFPKFEGDVPTIADVLGRTHTTHLISANHFLFQGLDESFDEAIDTGRRYMMFQEASDPMDFSSRYRDGSAIQRYVDFLTTGGKPLRSLANGLSYNLGGKNTIKPKSWGDEQNYQYANAMCEMIRDRMSKPGDRFLVANFMDLHGPYEVSDAALERYFPDTPREEVPMNVILNRSKTRPEKSYDSEQQFRLYKAAIWDFDRKVTSMIEDLVADDTFVAVFADHGWYDTNTAYSDERLHVPLTLFVPGDGPATVDHSVSLTDLPRTTAEVMLGDDGGFDGQSLLSVETDRTAVAEAIHVPNDIYEETHRIYVNRPSDGAEPEEIQHDCVLFRGDTKVQFVADEVEVIRGDDETAAELTEQGREIRTGGINYPEGEAEVYDEHTEERLKDLGYLE